MKAQLDRHVPDKAPSSTRSPDEMEIDDTVDYEFHLRVSRDFGEFPPALVKSVIPYFLHDLNATGK